MVVVDYVKMWLTKLFEEYKFVRRASVGLVFVMWAWFTWQVGNQLDTLTGSAAAAYGTLTGVIATVFKFYNDSRNRDKEIGA